ncbi:MAG: response regulator transcription factor [Lachnospiraceae bacterium]|nr:response regulator transcription factor [Lachnospiraceae bacterium]
MIDIYICDDEEGTRKKIREEIEQKILIEDYDMQVAGEFSHPEELLKAAKQALRKRNVYFLDVKLEDETYDGFLLGRELRRTDPYGTIIFITGWESLAYRTFQYHLEAFDYIVKGEEGQQESVDRCLEALQIRLRAEGKEEVTDVYTVKAGESLKHIPVKEILFFETSAKAHHILLRTKDSRVDFVGNLNEIEAQMGERFIRLHRSYLVAINKIGEVDLKHNLVRVEGMECPLSRKMKSELLRKIGKADTKS